MNVLFLTPDLPSPPRWGGARRMHGLIAGLARAHQVSVLSMVGPGEDHGEALAATRAYSHEVQVVANDHLRLSSARRRQLQLRSLLSPFSFERLVNYRPAMQAALDRLVARERFDIITVEFSKMAYYRFPSTARVVVDEHNIEYDILYRTFTGEKGVARKLYNSIEFLKLRREERQIWRQCDGCVLTSGRDERMLLRDRPTTRTAVVPNAVDTGYFRPEAGDDDPMTIAFFGANHYYPNIDGLQFFLREIMPPLKRQHPRAKLYILGYSPEVLYSWASEDVIITGMVDDLRPYLARARVIIAPLRIGGGTRFKILEAMSMGKAVVSTTIGAEGIDVRHDENILIGDTAETFAEQVGRLLGDAALARRLGLAARRLVEDRYDWQASVRRLDQFYADVLAAPPAASRS